MILMLARALDTAEQGKQKMAITPQAILPARERAVQDEVNQIVK